ncbi:carboxyltransferase domain-containing protein [Gordonia sp. LSe1-13]|uniref:Carboxyltransferase domain-containing protein n=1 Tax=Gordonia sesuvii TaxID=3116777 RepID=A0ABU7M8W6_9ACTN|nr:carboxyltransferase domain-containing protein [Gordonia sp. LSe1-13]
MRELPAGHDAIVLDFGDEDLPLAAVGRAAAALRGASESGALSVGDIVPTAHTVLVQAERGAGLDMLGVHRALRGVSADDMSADGDSAEVRIPVVYDGPDLDEVADIVDTTPDDVIDLHTTTVWRVQFMGFAPGFGYLVPRDGGDHPFDRVGRRSEARTRVPSGAIAIAAGYSAVYPRTSPGGWQLLGHTSIPMWDETADPPARLAPGSLVRFVVDE